MHPQWENTTLRRQAEDQLITLNLTIVYNQAIAGSTRKKELDIYRKPVSFRGTVYPSVAKASKETKVSETNIAQGQIDLASFARCLIRDPQNMDWQYASDPTSLNDEKIFNIDKAIPVMVHGQQKYRSIRDAARSNRINRCTLQRHH